jgi:tetratricopeptide (TPR) repeat protein
MLRGYDGRWAEACADLGEAQKLDPNEDRYAFDLALALRMSGRLDDYRQHCHTFLERAAGRGDSLPTADKAAKVALLVPVDAADRERACELADRVAGATEPPGVLPWFALCKSLADLRRQRWDSAIGWAERTIALNGAVRETQAAAYFIEASAYAQSGRAELARSTLARGQGLVNQTLWNVYNESWRDWLIADLLRAEALGLIRSSPNPAVPAAATRP